MKKVNVSAFKAKISAYLREVKRGKRYLILDRNVPVAVVSPNDGLDLEVSAPQCSFLEIIELIFKSSSFKGKPLSAALLRADRDKR